MRCSKLLLVASLVLGALTGAGAQTVVPERGTRAHAEFRAFYRNPDLRRVPALLSELDRAAAGDWTAHPPIAGFVAGLLVKMPANGAEFLPRNASPALRADFAVAYSLAGRPGEGAAIAREGGLGKKVIAAVRTTPLLARLTPRNATELDYLWGAAFATGDRRYIRPIVRKLTALAGSAEKADGILTAARFLRSGQGHLGTMKQRFDRRALLDIALGSAILVALSRGAPEHEFIRDAIRMDAPAGSHARRILAESLGRAS
jgi:hypothetical protein